MTGRRICQGIFILILTNPKNSKKTKRYFLISKIDRLLPIQNQQLYQKWLFGVKN